MRTWIVTMCLAFTASASAQDVSFPWQARLLGADGTPIQGELDLTIELFDSEADLTADWSDSFSVDADDGYVAVTLGSDVPIPLDLLSTGALWSRVTLTGSGAERMRWAEARGGPDSQEFSWSRGPPTYWSYESP